MATFLTSYLTGFKSNTSATADPTANDDSTDGYVVGSVWVSVSTDDKFTCVDNTATSAVWIHHMDVDSENTLTGNLLTSSSSYNIGSVGTPWGTLYGTATTAQYADLAENYLADADYPVGTVVEFGGELEVTKTTNYISKKVAGIISDKPAYLMNSSLEGEHIATIALTGRVPCRVIGKIEKGDLIVSSHIPGVATMFPDGPNPAPTGTVIGKAIQSKDSTEEGIIEVAVGIR